VTSARERFTLAHKLVHLFLGHEQFLSSERSAARASANDGITRSGCTSTININQTSQPNTHEHEGVRGTG